MKYKVIKAYDDAPEQPIQIEAGEVLEVIEESDFAGPWPNWMLCKGIDKQGWVPRQILRIKGKLATASKDYYAVEHKLSVGEVLIADYSLNGWIWGAKQGEPEQCAWAPLNHLQALASE